MDSKKTWQVAWLGITVIVLLMVIFSAPAVLLYFWTRWRDLTGRVLLSDGVVILTLWFYAGVYIVTWIHANAIMRLMESKDNGKRRIRLADQ